MGVQFKYAYGGVSTQEPSDKFDDVFEETWDGELWATKKTYHHSEPGLSFDYKYVFQAADYDEGDGYSNSEVVTSLCLVILPKSFCKAKRAELAKSVGTDEDRLDVTDVFREGWDGVVQFATETFEGEDRGKRLEAAKDTVASCIGTFDSLRGFYIDRRLNMVGMTGWDLIFAAKGRIKDALKHAMRRLEKEMKEKGKD